MPKLVELEDGRVIEFPDGMTDAQIDANLRLSLAGEQGVNQAEAGAVERSKPSANQRGADLFREQLSQAGSFGQTPQPEDMPEGAAAKLGMAGTIASLPFLAPTASALVTAPVATGKALLGGAIGSAALAEGGKWVGNRLPIVGGETAGKVLETAGGLVGGGVGGVYGPKVPIKELLTRLVGGGGKGLLSAALGGAESGAAKGAATQAAKTVAPEVVRKAELDIAIKEARLAKIAADAERAKELHAARLAKASAPKAPKTGPKAVPKPETAPEPAPRTEGATALQPEPEFIPDEAVSLVAEPLPFRPRGTTKPATNLGGKAKPGPAPTPPDDLKATLQASIDAAKAAKEGAVRGKGTPLLEEALDTASGLKGPRIQEGAQRVGRGVGMTKEEVRTATGPLLGEKLGEASPIIPKEPWTRIVETMKALPKTGGHREAYVARAAPGKNRGQMEQLRRTLEQLGLLLPIGAGGVALSE